jgi:hypothetical protein
MGVEIHESIGKTTGLPSRTTMATGDDRYRVMAEMESKGCCAWAGTERCGATEGLTNVAAPASTLFEVYASAVIEDSAYFVLCEQHLDDHLKDMAPKLLAHQRNEQAQWESLTGGTIGKAPGNLVMVHQELTPDLALLKRDSFQQLLLRAPREMLTQTVWEPICNVDRAALHINKLAMGLPEIDPVIWHTDLWNAAVRGANEAFAMPMPTVPLGATPQVWQWDGTLLADGNGDGYNTGGPCSLQMLIVLPVQGVDSLNFQKNEIGKPTGKRGVTFVLALFPESGATLPFLRVFPPCWEGDDILPALRPYVAALHFLYQELVSIEPARLSRARRREFARLHPQLPEPTVRVVALRKRTHNVGMSGAEGSSVEWQHQWLVRGHWRQQWYGKTGVHQPKYIAPYAKGPEGKPLKTPKKTIFAVVR